MCPPNKKTGNYKSFLILKITPQLLLHFCEKLKITNKSK